MTLLDEPQSPSGAGAVAAPDRADSAEEGTATWPGRTRARAWRGEWVWSERPALVARSATHPFGALDPERFDQRVLFRATIDLDEVPSDAELAITADSRYVAYVNGQEIGRGPVRHGRRELHADVLPATEHLLPGRNVLAIVARFYGHPVPWWEPSPASFTLGGGSLVAELSGDGRVLTASGAGWKAREASAWTPMRPAGLLSSQLPEVFDARTEDHGWEEPDYDDSTWPSAVVLAEHSVIGPVGRTTPSTEPYGPITTRPVPLLVGDTCAPVTVVSVPLPPTAAVGRLRTLEQDLGEALDITDGLASAPTVAEPFTASIGCPPGRSLLIVDFGRIVAGIVQLGFTAGGGTSVRGALVEVATTVALESTAAFAITARAGETRFTASDPAGGRYLVLSIAADESAFVLHTVAVQERHRPRAALAPFRSSDPAVDEIFRVAVRTVDLTAQDAYVDCPTREQRAWTGDAVVHQSVDLVTNADWSLAVWSPQLLAQPRADGLLPMVVAGDFATTEIPTIPDWSLHWLHSVHALYRYTGDRDLVAGLLGVAEGVLRWFVPFLRSDGLLHEVTGWVLIDWSPVQVAGCSAALNALWARGLREFAEMAGWLGDRGRAAWAEGLHDSVRTGFERFWDQDRSAYRDNIIEGRLGTAVSEHTAATAVCAGLVPEHRNATVLALLLDRDAMFTASPLSDHGSDRNGPSAGAPVSLREAPEWDTERLVVGAQPFYRAIVHDAIARLGAADEIVPLLADWTTLLETGPSAFRECWEGGSFAHGWSATPARDLLVHVLGVSPSMPGYARVRIEPHLGPLRWAAGTVPTPHGPVTVRADADTVDVESPVPVEFIRRNGTQLLLPPGRQRIPNA